MKLQQYFDKNPKIKLCEAAKELGITRQRLWEIRTGSTPSRKLANKIEKWSKGKVKAVELIFPDFKK
jgi:hypothetical protein